MHVELCVDQNTQEVEFKCKNMDASHHHHILLISTYHFGSVLCPFSVHLNTFEYKIVRRKKGKVEETVQSPTECE